MASILRTRHETEAAKPLSIYEFDGQLAAMQAKLLEIIAREDEILGNIAIEGKGWRPLPIAAPAALVKPKELPQRTRDALGDVLPPPPAPEPPRERFSSPVAETVIVLQRELEACRQARQILNEEIAKRQARSSRLLCAENAPAYADKVRAVTGALVALAEACRDHEAFVTSIRAMGVQPGFLQLLGRDTLARLVGPNATEIVNRAADVGHHDDRAALAKAREPIPVPPGRPDPFAAARARIARAQRYLEAAKQYSRTQWGTKGGTIVQKRPVLEQ
jgi:hypothetical protein